MTKISNYKFQLRGTLLVGGSTVAISNDLELDAEVVFTDEACVITNRDRTVIERVRASATGGVLTLLKRGMEQDSETEDAGLEKEWREGAICYMTILGPQLADILTYTEYKKGVSGGRFATTATRDTALGGDGVATEPYTGVFVEATGLHYNYNTSTNQWETVETGTATPNASTTVAGSTEQATPAQVTAGTATGETGAPLFATPADLSAQVQSGTRLYLASTTGSDTYTGNLTPALTAYTTGMFLPCKFTTTNTGACSVNINGLGAKSIKTLDGNDPQTGVIRANGVALLQYDGTNFVIHSSDFATSTVMGLDYKVTLGGVGSAGNLSISSGTTTITGDGALAYAEYDNITISGTAILTSDSKITHIKCKGNFTMSAGTIDMNGLGGAGGAAVETTDGVVGGATRNNYHTVALVSASGDGGGPSTTGGTAGLANRSTAGDVYNMLFYGGGGGSGGGASSNPGGAGGAGGGILIIEIGGTINFTGGTIRANGANAVAPTSGTDGGGGGGGGGGAIFIKYRSLTALSGTIQAQGGNGGTGGSAATRGAGGGGGSYAAGGAGGANGGAGTAGSNGIAIGATATVTGGSAGSGTGSRGGGGGGGFVYVKSA